MAEREVAAAQSLGMPRVGMRSEYSASVYSRTGRKRVAQQYPMLHFGEAIFSTAREHSVIRLAEGPVASPASMPREAGVTL